MILDELVASARQRAAALAERADELRASLDGRPPALDFAAALSGPGLSVVAEVKRRSPSAGTMADSLDPASVSRAYEQGGAAAISVLTEPDSFGGSMADLREVRAAVGLPVLRKDFMIAPEQVWESRAGGADAVLLIVAALTDGELSTLLGAAEEAGLTALVEVHDREEAERAMAAGARVVGVNNRDLRTFEVDLRTAELLAVALEGAAVRVAESGIWSPADAARMAAAGYQAVLVGESAVRSDTPAAFVRSLLTG